MYIVNFTSIFSHVCVCGGGGGGSLGTRLHLCVCVTRGRNVVRRSKSSCWLETPSDDIKESDSNEGKAGHFLP